MSHEKVALVIGGRGFVGGGVCQGIHDAYADAKIVITSRSSGPKLSDAVARLRELGLDAFGEVVEAMDEGQMCALRDRIAQQYGKLDILVNCQGGNNPKAWWDPSIPIASIDVSAWERVMRDNIISLVISWKVFATFLADGGHPSWVVNIGSMSGIDPLPGVGAYSAAKAAVHNLTTRFALDACAKGWPMCVNTLVPGFFPADQNAKLLFDATQPDGLAERGREAFLRGTPRHRKGEAEDLIAPTRLLVTCTDYMTAAEIVLDGGFSRSSLRVFK